MTTLRVAVFGGSFNPPHTAHLETAVVVLACHPIDRVLVVPAFQHPFAKALAPFEDRVRMCELAMGWLPGVEVTRVEQELRGEGKTLHTLEHLRRVHPDWTLRLVMGADLVAESSKWYRFDRVRELAPPLLIGRAGIDVHASDLGPPPRVVLPPISSTEVRAHIRAGAWEELGDIVPRAVLEHVRARGLYRE
jgi:nicotinate-nucleotide adenylyltransferase